MTWIKFWIQPTELIAQNQDSLNKHEGPVKTEPSLNSPEWVGFNPSKVEVYCWGTTTAWVIPSGNLT